MTRLRHTISILTIIICLTIISPSISFGDAENIFKVNNNAVVVIVGYDYAGNPISQGSGFIISKDGAIVTNYHVISKSVNFVVKAGREILEVNGLISIDKDNDLVILKAKAENLSIVKLGNIYKTNIGEKIYVISSPEGFENTITEGIVSGIREVNNNMIFQISAPVSKGSSGGPVFNKNGEVIGIVTFLIKDAQNLNFAMPVNQRLLSVWALGSDKIIPLTEFQKESKKDYIRWLVEVLAASNKWDWNKGNTPVVPDELKIEVYEKILILNPYHIDARRHLALEYFDKGKRKKGLEHHKILKKTDPSFALALEMLYDF